MIQIFVHKLILQNLLMDRFWEYFLNECVGRGNWTGKRFWKMVCLKQTVNWIVEMWILERRKLEKCLVLGSICRSIWIPPAISDWGNLNFWENEWSNWELGPILRKFLTVHFTNYGRQSKSSNLDDSEQEYRFPDKAQK